MLGHCTGLDCKDLFPKGLEPLPRAPHLDKMIDISWGEPLHFVVTTDGDVQKFSTLEQADFWLKQRWPLDNAERHVALSEIDAARHCLVGANHAKSAFVRAARAAGFRKADRSL